MINIEIADVNFTIHCSDASLLSEPQSAAYAPFMANQPVQGTGSFTIDVQLEIKDFLSSEGLTEIFEGNGSWSMFRKGGKYYLSLNPSAADGSECITCFELPLEKAIVYCAKMDISEAEGKRMVRNPFTYPLDQLLVTFALAQRNGAVIHSSGVDFHGRGFLFSGRSGAGKSTLSRNFASRGYEVLSDDRIVVRRIDNSFRIFGTPWSGEAGIAHNKDLPLDGIFFIRHGTEHIMKKITPAEAVERLMPVTSIPWFDEKIMWSVLSFCEDMVSHVPAYELSFKPDNGVIGLFEEFVSE